MTQDYDLNAALEQALGGLASGDLVKAERLARQAIDKHPEDAEGWSVLGLALSRQNQAEEARAALEKAVQMEPQEPRWHLHLGRGLNNLNLTAEAERAFASATEMSQGHPQAMVPWADALQALGRHADAAQVYGRVLQVQQAPEIWMKAGDALMGARDTINAAHAYERAFPDDQRPAALTTLLADLYINLNQYDDAERFNARLLRDDPKNVDAGLRAANLKRWRGDHEGAIEIQKQFLKTSPGHPLLIAALLDDGAADIAADAEKLAADTSLDMDNRRRLNFALARHFDKAEDADKAWHHASVGNALYAADEPLDLKAEYAMLDKAVMAYHLIPDGEPRHPNVIYVMGPPRVGGSLLQTVLSRVDGVASAGERAALMSWLPDMLDAPEKIAELAEQLAEADIAGMTKAHGEASLFVDKTPQHVFIAGLLAKIHPGAKFINPARNSGDMTVSMYLHDFGPGFAYTRSIKDIQAYLEFQAHAVKTWRDAGLPIIDHDHDAFIAEPDKAGEALFETLGLSWSPDVLETGGSDNVVKTFSARQVRGGVTQKFAGRGERYADFLKKAGFKPV